MSQESTSHPCASMGSKVASQSSKSFLHQNEATYCTKHLNLDWCEKAKKFAPCITSVRDSTKMLVYVVFH